MYEQYWGLKEKPFENTPDPRFLYYSAEHEEALVRLLYAVRERKGAAMLTGEYGCGKTLISRTLLKELETGRYQSVVITHPHFGPLEFLGEILYQLGVPTRSQRRTVLLHALQDKFRGNMTSGVDTVIIIDEAQAIQRDQLFEELRLLLNFQLDDRFLLTLLFLGQPELKEKIARLPQLRQRIGVRYHLVPLDEEDTARYIERRMTVAGAAREIFLPDAVREVHRASGGTPREINNVCDMALLVGFGNKADRVDLALVQDIAKDLEVR